MESHVETGALGVGMGLQGHTKVLDNIIAHLGTGTLDQYHLGAFHLHVIYGSFDKKKKRVDLGIPNH